MLVATAAVGVAGGMGGLVVRQRWWNHPPGGDLEALSQHEFNVIQAIAEAWMPPGEGPPDLSGSEANVGKFVDEIVSRMGAEQRKQFKLLIHLLDDLTMAIEFKPFHQLDRFKRSGHLQVWMNSPWYLLRQATAAVVILISMGYTVHPEVAKHISPWFRCGYGA